MPLTDKQVKYRAHQRRQAGVSAWTDAAIVRAHLNSLLDAGFTFQRISVLARVDRQTLRLITGASGRPQPARTRRDLASRILAITPADLLAVPAGFVPAIGSQRRIQALVACGWSQLQLAGRLGIDQAHLHEILRRRVLLAPTAIAVRDLYEEIWDQPPPQEDRWQRGAAVRARRHAAVRGWPPPAAWDDDIDDPAATPADGWQRAERLTSQQIADEAAELFRQGLDRHLAAERLGMVKSSLDTVLAREQKRRAS